MYQTDAMARLLSVLRLSTLVHSLLIVVRFNVHPERIALDSIAGL
jgi:hypothetical protein